MHMSSKLMEMDKRRKAELAQKLAETQGARLDYTTGAPDLAYKQHAKSTETPAAVVPTVWLAPPRAPPYGQSDNVAQQQPVQELEIEECWNMRQVVNILVILMGMSVVLRYLTKHRSFLRFRNRKRRLIITYQPPRNVKFLGSEELSARMGKDAPPTYCECTDSTPETPVDGKSIKPDKPPALYSRIIVTSNTGGPPITVWDKYNDQKTQEIIDLVKNSQNQTRKVPSTIYINMPMEPNCRDKKRESVFIGLSSKDGGPFGVDFGLTINKKGEIKVADPEQWVECEDDDTKKVDDDVKIAGDPKI